MTARNDPRLNHDQRLQLQGWRANCDINVVIDYHSCIEYLTKYTSKAETLSAVARDSFVSVVTKLNDDLDAKKTIKKLMMKAVGQRDMSAQEVMHQLLSLKLFSSSFSVITVSLDGSRKLSFEEDQVTTEPSLLDDYATRSSFIDDHPKILHLNFVQFVSQYFVSDGYLKKRTKPVIVQTFPKYSSSTKSPYYGLFCKYQLLRYKPWQQTCSSAWENEDECDEVFISHWDQFLQTDQAESLVPNWSQELNNVSAYYEDLSDSATKAYQCVNSGEREQWMFLAELNLSSQNNSNKTNLNIPNDYWQTDSKHFTDEEIGNMPSWIQQQNESHIFAQASSRDIDVATLNDAQHMAYSIVFDHYLKNTADQLLLVVTGLAGSGKSDVTDSVKNLLNEKCKVMAFWHGSFQC